MFKQSFQVLGCGRVGMWGKGGLTQSFETLNPDLACNYSEREGGGWEYFML